MYKKKTNFQLQKILFLKPMCLWNNNFIVVTTLDTIAQLDRENSQALLMLFYLVVDQTATITHVSGCYNLFFLITLKNCVEIYFFFLIKSYMFLKHILIGWNIEYDMILFYRLFWKN